MIVAPSILSADFSNLEKEIEDVSDAEFLHIDVMDGHFVPNITIGPLILESIRSKSNMVFDVHLMITDPKKYAPIFISKGADYVTFHFEACKSEDEIMEIIDLIKSLNCKVGLSIKPNTDVKVLDKFLDKLDLVLVMSVEPGFGGQAFMDSSLDKIRYLKGKKELKGYKYLIEVDGGINEKSAIKVKDAGCEVVVAGTYIFKNKDRKKLIEELKKL